MFATVAVPTTTDHFFMILGAPVFFHTVFLTALNLRTFCLSHGHCRVFFASHSWADFSLGVDLILYWGIKGFHRLFRRAFVAPRLEYYNFENPRRMAPKDASPTLLQQAIEVESLARALDACKVPSKLMFGVQKAKDEIKASADTTSRPILCKLVCKFLSTRLETFINIKVSPMNNYKFTWHPIIVTYRTNPYYVISL